MSKTNLPLDTKIELDSNGVKLAQLLRTLAEKDFPHLLLEMSPDVFSVMYPQSEVTLHFNLETNTLIVTKL